MANKYRSEKIFIFGDKGWRLRATMQLLAEFEGETGSSLAELVEKIRSNMILEADYLALEQVIRRHLKLEEPFSERTLISFKKQIKELLFETFLELNPKHHPDLLPQQIDLDMLNIPWKELMHICAYHLKIPFEQFWGLTLPEIKVLLHGLGGTVYSRISPTEIKEMRDILALA